MISKKILIVEDEECIRDVIKFYLNDGPFEVLEAENGAIAVEILESKERSQGICLVLSDIRMPGKNGVELVDFMATNFPSIPLVVISGYPDEELAESLLKKGVKDYLVKPVEKAKFLDTINKVVDAASEELYCRD